MSLTISSAVALALIGIAPTLSATTRFATSEDGTRIAYEVTGSGPAIILLHGAGQTRRVWHDSEYVDRLRREFTVITMDLRGHGDSGAPDAPADYRVDRIRQDILSVANSAQVSKFILWAFSYGANVGRYLAAESDRVNAMIYVGIPFGEAVDPIFRHRILERNPRPSWLTALLDYPPIEPRAMGVPTLWVVGTKNAVAMESVKKYRSTLSSTRVELALLEGLTHMEELTSINASLPIKLSFARRYAR